MQIAAEMGTPALVREFAKIKQESTAASFEGRPIPLARHWWLSEVVNELRHRSILD